MNLIYARRNRLSEIFSDIGQVCFASIFLPFMINGFDILKAIVGLILSLLSWVISLALVEKV
jgi:cellulose synthase/poly-beta-1,6-N-acetylglucosamine synthase-like glycosyltransferase